MGSKKNSKNSPSSSGGSSSGVPKDSMEYKEKRMKNNIAVKRSRDKTKAKAREAQSRVELLQVQNEQLQNTVDEMTAELKYLKELLISQAGTSEYLSPSTAADLEDLLQDDATPDLGKLTAVLGEIRRISELQKGGDLNHQHHHVHQDQDIMGYNNGGGGGGYGHHQDDMYHGGHGGGGGGGGYVGSSSSNLYM